MGGWHHQLSGREFEQTPRDSGGWRSLDRVCEVAKSQAWLSNWTTARTTQFLGRELRSLFRTAHCSLSQISLTWKIVLRNKDGAAGFFVCFFPASLSIPPYPSKPEAGRQEEEMLYLVTSTDQQWFWFPLAIADVQIDFCSVGCLWVWIAPWLLATSYLQSVSQALNLCRCWIGCNSPHFLFSGPFATCSWQLLHQKVELFCHTPGIWIGLRTGFGQ